MNLFKKNSSFNLERFSAIKLANVQEAMQHVTPRTRADLLGRMRMHHESLNTVGQVSCYLSHFTLVKQFLDSDFTYALILEDDLRAEDAAHLNTLANEFIGKNHWDIALLGWGRKMRRYADGRAHLFPSAPNFVYGAHAYMLTRKAAKSLLNLGYPIEMQWDSALQAIADQQGLRVIPTIQNHLKQSGQFKSDTYSFCPFCEPHYVWIYLGLAFFLGLLLALGLLSS
jgi:GR25 family glycosyltransferase involved in LPS biosynthesis